LRLNPEGAWQIGSHRESCGYEGYPNTPAFAKYYTNGLAVFGRDPKTAYGALLYRLGERGRVYPVRAGEVIEDDVGGTLYLDVNERPDRDLRADNRGALNVRALIENP
jgi:hypothetical protein